jgi:hypothetical protein
MRRASSFAAGVGVTPLALRSNRVWPRSASKVFICVVTVGCATPSRDAADVTDPLRWTARKLRSRSSEIDISRILLPALLMLLVSDAFAVAACTS